MIIIERGGACVKYPRDTRRRRVPHSLQRDRHPAGAAAPRRVYAARRLRRTRTLRQVPRQRQRRAAAGLPRGPGGRRRGDPAPGGGRAHPHGDAGSSGCTHRRERLRRRRGSGHHHRGGAAVRSDHRAGGSRLRRLERTDSLRRGCDLPHPVHPGAAGRPVRAVWLHSGAGRVSADASAGADEPRSAGAEARCAGREHGDAAAVRRYIRGVAGRRALSGGDAVPPAGTGYPAGRAGALSPLRSGLCGRRHHRRAAGLRPCGQSRAVPVSGHRHQR